MDQNPRKKLRFADINRLSPDEVAASRQKKKLDLPPQVSIPSQHAMAAQNSARGGPDTSTLTAVAAAPPRQSPSAPVSAPAPQQQPRESAQGLGTPFSAASSAAREKEAEDEFDLQRYIGIVLRRKGIILLITALLGFVSAISYLRSEKYYTASARLLFRPASQAEIFSDQINRSYWAQDKMIITHLQLLPSSIVLQRVVENLADQLSEPQIRQNLNIRQSEYQGIKNDIIELSFQHPDATVAMTVLNELCTEYLEYSREVNSQEVTRLVYKLEAQIKKTEDELRVKEDRLREFKERNNLISLSSEANLLLEKLSAITLELQQTKLQLIESRERLQALRQQIGMQKVNVVQSMVYDNSYQTRLAELEIKLSTLLSQFSDEHYKVIEVREEIAKLKEELTQQVQQRVARTTTLIKNPIREGLLQDLVSLTIKNTALESKRIAQEQISKDLNEKLQMQPAIEQRFAYLQREIESGLQTLRMLKKKHEEARIKRDSQEVDLKILQLADRPEHAVRSEKLSRVFFGLFIGLFLGIAIALLLEYFDQTLKSPQEVENCLQLPLLGIVPLIEGNHGLVTGHADLNKSLLEPLRALRASIKHVSKQKKLKNLMICSAIKGEGKTTLSANLAITFALDGKKVALVDADLRRPQIHKLFSIDKAIGVSDLLQKKLPLEDIIKPSQFENLSLITSGSIPQNPAELLDTDGFDHLQKQLEEQFDLVLYDSPALLPVSDVLTMAPKMDGVIMVVRTFWTPQKAVQQARQQLQRLNCSLIGGILNPVSYSRGFYPYYYGYYGYYSYKYSYDQDPKEKMSVRLIGTKIEQKLKGAIVTTKIALPRSLHTLSEFGRYLLSRKTFWLLIALLAAVITLKALYLPEETVQINSADISLLHQQTSSAALPSSAAAPSTSQPKAIHTATDQQTSDMLASALAQSPAAHLKDSLAVWNTTLNTVNLEGHLRFYAAEHFKFPGGGYTAWSSHLQKRFDRLSSRPFSQTITSVSAEPFKQNMYLQRAQSILSHGSQSMQVEYTFIWQLQKNEKWRIIGQKSREILDEQAAQTP